MKSSNAKNEENIKCRLYELRKKDNKELQMVKASLKEKMERMSTLSGQMAKLSEEHAKRIRYVAQLAVNDIIRSSNTELRGHEIRYIEMFLLSFN